jgi:hypothetical protein
MFTHEKVASCPPLTGCRDGGMAGINSVRLMIAAVCVFFLTLMPRCLCAAEWEMMCNFAVNGASMFRSSAAIIVPDGNAQSASLWASTSTVTPHLYVSTTGNVGIGTATPAAALHVVGVSSITDSITVGGVSNASVPRGAVMFFNLDSCPTGWTLVAGAQGRYLVGLPASGGTNGGIIGTQLSANENRPVGQHSHTASQTAHNHSLPSVFNSGSNNYCTGSVGTCNPPATVTGAATPAITVNNSGTVAGTNAPYITFMVCSKD